MKKKINKDYTSLDRPEVLMNLFHPRRDWHGSSETVDKRDFLIPVDKEIVVGGREYFCNTSAPTILFFHGNGEIVSDYDEIAPFYNRNGINFLPVDYRGYGRSTGNPTVGDMMMDAHRIFEYVKDRCNHTDHSGPLIVMGRSLGSASALELAFHYGDRVNGLIIESGFAYSAPLLRLLGVNTAALGFDESEGFENISKIETFVNPTLVIHAEYDHIIPFSDGQALFDACPANDKTLLKIPGANHNDILACGFPQYMGAIQQLAQKLTL